MHKVWVHPVERLFVDGRKTHLFLSTAFQRNDAMKYLPVNKAQLSHPIHRLFQATFAQLFYSIPPLLCLQFSPPSTPPTSSYE